MGNKTLNHAIVVAHPGSEMYGSDRMLLEDVKGLLRGGWSVTVGLPDEGLLATALREHGAKVEVCTTPVLRKSIFTPRGARGFFKDTFRGLRDTHALLKRSRASVVLVNTTIIPLWVVYARLSRRKVVLHVHESERHAPRPMRLGLSLPGAFAHKIITNSQFTNEAYFEHVPWARKNSQIIYNGIAGPAHAVPAREVLTGPARLLYVGRLSERKGLLVLLDAVALLQQRAIEVELSLIGASFEGYEAFEQALRERVKALPNPDQVKFLGFHADVWPHYAGTDIAVVPAVMEESFGNTAVEGVLANRPVVASRIGGLEEAVAPYQSVLLVEPGNAQSLADAISRIIDEWDEFRSAAAEAAALARQTHDPEQFGERIDAALKSIVSTS
ncbi:glycosyltransferase [Glutamicibacter ardleyensis]|uniref:glycosyltransferase n=1 Tax=Glutamicibacter ardleyensis TaxID=225894 RepID=UPI003FD22954